MIHLVYYIIFKTLLTIIKLCKYIYILLTYELLFNKIKKAPYPRGHLKPKESLEIGWVL